jgi:hypothetical protein
LEDSKSKSWLYDEVSGNEFTHCKRTKQKEKRVTGIGIDCNVRTYDWKSNISKIYLS